MVRHWRKTIFTLLLDVTIAGLPAFADTVLNTTINQSMRDQHLKLHVPQKVAQTAIEKIIDANPAFKSEVANLVAHDTTATTDKKKREKAIHSVYLSNPSFKHDVDTALINLKNP
jgi:hypothetical protein